MVTKIYLIMGVSGSGKSTVGRALSQKIGVPFFDADDYHPALNVEKMASGQALNDEDRQPWLETLAQLLEQQEMRAGAILACSALKAAYRKTLVAPLVNLPHWVFLQGNPELISARMQARDGHFMPPSLLASQFAALEVPAYAQVVDIAKSVDEVVKEVCLFLE